MSRPHLDAALTSVRRFLFVDGERALCWFAKGFTRGIVADDAGYEVIGSPPYTLDYARGLAAGKGVRDRGELEAIPVEAADLAAYLRELSVSTPTPPKYAREASGLGCEACGVNEVLHEVDRGAGGVWYVCEACAPGVRDAQHGEPVD